VTRTQREAITEEELRDMVAAHESLTKDERKLIDDVFAAGERQLREVMLPRTEVAFLDAGMTLQPALRETASSRTRATRSPAPRRTTSSASCTCATSWSRRPTRAACASPTSPAR
jgi:CBS domain containing-hemolysin-like protein